MEKPLSIQYVELLRFYLDIMEGVHTANGLTEGIAEGLIEANDNTNHALAQSDVDVLKDLLPSFERFFEGSRLLSRHPFTNVPDKVHVFTSTAVVVRDCEWMVLETQRLQRECEQAAASLTDEYVKPVMQLHAEALEKSVGTLDLIVKRLLRTTSEMYVVLHSLGEKEAGEEARKLKDEIGRIQGIDRKIRTNKDDATVEELAIRLGISQQAVSKRIQRLIRDNWLDPPSKSGKQYWSPSAALIIQENPKGRRKRE